MRSRLEHDTVRIARKVVPRARRRSSPSALRVRSLTARLGITAWWRCLWAASWAGGWSAGVRIGVLAGWSERCICCHWSRGWLTPPGDTANCTVGLLKTCIHLLLTIMLLYLLVLQLFLFLFSIARTALISCRLGGTKPQLLICAASFRLGLPLLGKTPALCLRLCGLRHSSPSRNPQRDILE